jgi:hypothetical protein
MTRRPRAETDVAGHGSLLPIVINLVGVLLLVVFVVGERIKGIEALPEDDAQPRLLADLDSRRAEAGELEEEIHGLNAQANSLSNLSASRRAQRAELAAAIAADEKEFALRRSKLDADSRREFDISQQEAQARAELARLEAAKDAAKHKPGKSYQIQNYPTPISHVVNGKEMHFQLKDGRICPIPLDDLLSKFKSSAPEKVWRLKESDEMTESVGPIGGFHLNYTLVKEEMTYEQVRVTGHGGGSMIRLSRWELEPVKADIGETAAEAMGQASAFRESISNLRPAEWTITLWIYPDSFEVFRAVRKELYQQGFAIAGRPLPMGIPIAASVDGTKSSAE